MFRLFLHPISISLLILCWGCSPSQNQKPHDQPVAMEDKGTGADSKIMKIDTLIYGDTLRVYYDPGFKNVINQAEEKDFTDGGLSFVPLVIHYKTCKVGFGTYTGFYEPPSYFYYLNDSLEVEKSQVIRDQSGAFWITLNWEMGRVAIVRFKVEEGCPVIIPCGTEGNQRNPFVQMKEPGDFIFDLKEQRFYSPILQREDFGKIAVSVITDSCLVYVETIEGPDQVEETHFSKEYVSQILGK